MTEQFAASISIVIAVVMTLVSLAYGVTIHWLQRRSRESVPPGRRPNTHGLVIFFSATTAGGFAYLWNRPVIEPPVVQVLLFGILPAALGYAASVVLQRRTR